MPGLEGRIIIQDLLKVIEEQSSDYGVEAMAHNLLRRQPVEGGFSSYCTPMLAHQHQSKMIVDASVIM